MERRLLKAAARVMGDDVHPGLRGTVYFYQQCGGVLVQAEITGLPREGFFAFHIHEGGSCRGRGYPETGGHYDPRGQPHPDHAGDLPPLLSTAGTAKMTVLTHRFRVSEIIGKTVIIHENPDDFTTQPSGNPGSKIACGVIRRIP